MADPTSYPEDTDQRPAKKRALSPASRQSASINALFANPSRALAPTTSTTKAIDAPPELVTNVQGSSAGAGSGEFFVYKAARRREYDRLAAMDAESAAEAADAQWEAEKLAREAKDRARGGKNKARRDKAKLKRLGTAGPEHKKRTVMEYKPGGADGEEQAAVKVVEAEGITIHDD